MNEGSQEQLYIYTHKKFSFSFNRDRIIEVNLTAENPVPLVRGTQLEFTYSASWVSTDIPFEKRFQKYLDNNFFEHQVFIHSLIFFFFGKKKILTHSFFLKKDSLVLYFQFLYDGDFPNGFSCYDSYAYLT